MFVHFRKSGMLSKNYLSNAQKSVMTSEFQNIKNPESTGSKIRKVQTQQSEPFQKSEGTKNRNKLKNP